MVDDQRLDGWKAIGNFLGRERTTAIRWAKERGLPVHRVPGGRTGTVYAVRAELAQWLASDRSREHNSVDTLDHEVDTSHHKDVEQLGAPKERKRLPRRLAWLAALCIVTAIAAWSVFGRASASTKAPISIAAVAFSTANPETVEFARALTADLARFANASADLAIYEREPGTTPDTQYAVRTEIERAKGKIVAHAHLVAVQNGEVLWSRRFEQSEPALSALRERVAANIVGLLYCSFGTLAEERLKARTADVAQLMAICQDFEENNLGAAQERARQLTVARPDLAVAWAWLAVIQGHRLDETDSTLQKQALANAERAKKIAPGKACTWLALAAATGRGFASPDALPFIEEGLRMHPGHSFLLSQRSLILFNLGYVQDSVAPALDAVRNDLSSLSGRDIAVRRLAAAGRAKEAAQLQSENERLWPDHPKALATHARIITNVAALQKTDLDAISDNERLAITEPYVAYMQARLYERGGNRQAALGWLAQAPVRDAHKQWSLLFWPDTAGLRAEPAFFRKMADLGLVRWWIARGKWPDFCSEPGLKYDCATEAAKLRYKPTLRT